MSAPVINVFAITDDDGGILQLSRTMMFGVPVTTLAFFASEDDALEVLYAAERDRGLSGFQVRKVLELGSIRV